ncbi:glycoside hydrolase family 3 C-terminal domain-containing protein [Streptomyces smyrnaeus]|uniref:Glycoside hydrolase family 3 C-terminal domain-containing protein n=1 Tax=Streptomyces smyrnaeus TaxID=1387713 RepID=A0ABS3XNF1_9ACTN|nr:glycoside hydrolase family 3 protein [Streptomyces smyrnaeus]MBO8196934.1 glycoside hydrolase family 3 C-terminal domain-containing protein [Streptomyces smyrnaeus]
MQEQGTPRRHLLALGIAVPLAAAGTGTAGAVPATSRTGRADRAGARAGHPFQDPGLPFAERVEDLLGRLTRGEKISLLHQHQPAVPRLGIRSFRTGTEALHGLAWLGKATVFPQALGLASTWNPALIERVGAAVGDEARGFQHERPKGWGLNLWAPVVNLLRDPRWGRNEEGYSEDPYLTGAVSVAYGTGLQGEDPRYLKTAPTIKHYLANNTERNRSTSDSILPARVRQEYYEAAFEPALSGDAVTGVMTSYNLVNGRPATVNPGLNDTVRKWAKRELFHVTDADAPNNLVNGQSYYPTLAEADAAALTAGIDSFTSDSEDSSKTVKALTTALDKGLISESDLDTAVRHLLAIRFRLGEFDPDGGPYAKITKSVVDSPEHRALARETAREAIVLLKNAPQRKGGALLPLDARRLEKVAVVGPLADTLYTDWYSGSLPYAVTPREGVAERLGSGGKVTGGESVDRIALRNAATGAYLTAGSGADGAVLTERATSAGATEQFDVFDWGQGIVTLRSAANAKYLGYDGKVFRNDQEQPGGWFVQQQFTLVEQDDGTRLVRYAGYDARTDWFGDKEYFKAGEDGTVTLVAEKDATRYRAETVRDGVAEAVAAARDADVAVVVVGTMPAINGREDHDRTDMALAEGQAALVKAVHRANPRTVVVLESSYPQTVNWEQAHIPALVWTTHAGQETGNALADVLFGDHNPAGRLTQTWYRSQDDLPDLLEYDIIKADRTYLYFRGEALYPFGHGLSYTTFRYGEPRLSARTVEPDGTVTVSVKLTNTGRRDGDEVVQLYIRRRGSRDKQPLRQLRGFERVRLKAGRSTTVRLRLRAADLAHWDVTRGRKVVESGVVEVQVGASCTDIRGRTTLRVRGEKIPPRDLTGTTRAADFDDYRGVRLVDESKARGEAVGADEDRAWIVFRDADLGRGAEKLTARLAREGRGSGTLTLRLGSPRGRVVGSAQVPSTGDRYDYRTVTARLRGARGRHDVYLVFSDPMRLSTFALR